MATFVMLTRLNPQTQQAPGALADLSHEIRDCVRRNCPDVEWKHSYVLLGPADFLDIFTAPDIESALKVATVIRCLSHATTEIWGATEWEAFIKIASQPLSSPKAIKQSDYLHASTIPTCP